MKKLSSLILTTSASCLLLAGCGSGSTGLKLGEERIDPSESHQAIEMAELIRKVSLDRAGEQKPLKRFNQVKTNGCVVGEFKVKSNLPNDLAQGLFSRPDSYQATLRFANASQMDDTKSDFRGLAIKVQTKNKGQEQDFLFNSQPALFASTPKVFHQFIKAQASGNLMGFAFSYPGATNV